ncbi:hypothetical protein DL546_000830 [Coniochaeta pulveracea]|nr:hypothetical protein DL546_000830 [Coniochaeta pulveracea]
MDLDFQLFKGASIQFKDLKNAAERAEQVASMPAVKNLWPVHVYSIPEHTVHSVGSPSAAEYRKRADAANDTFTPHLMTQVNKLRAEGIDGKGIKIAVVDTGTDYNHPALGGCFGPGCLVSFGTDLVGDKYNGFNIPVPDPDPVDNCNGHGSHVAGIIAAQTNNPYGIIGAATGVTLGSFKVFGCDGQVGNDVLIAAFNMAYEAGADLITASIGGASGWSEDNWAVAVQRIVEAGVPCTVSAGNSGDEGIFFASTAANGKRVTAIASVDNTLSPAILTEASYTISGSANNVSFGFTPGTPDAWAGVSLPLYSVSLDATDPANACTPLPDDTPDLSNKIVLIRRGSCTFAVKLANAAAKGAKYVIFYNNVGGVIAVTGTVDAIKAVAMVTADQGATWINALKAGQEVVVHMVDSDSAEKILQNFPNTLTPGYLSSYTSWGPTNEVDFYPDLAAPGGMILSTYPLALGGYAVLSGTSMACPITAAVYALIMQKRGIKDPQTIESLLAATANPNIWSDGAGHTLPSLAPAAQQGAGLIQAYDAAYATTILSRSGISFNDTDNFAPTQKFDIKNIGKSDVTFTLSNVGALTAYTFADDTSIEVQAFPNTFAQGVSASLAFPDGSSVTVPAGQTKSVTVVATQPQGLDAKRLPVYSGYIALNGTDGSSLSLPYMGVVGSMHSLTVLDAEDTYISQSTDEDYAPVASNKTFLLPPQGHVNDTQYANVSLPVIVLNLAMGSPFVRVDVVPVKTCRKVNTTEILGTQTIGPIMGAPYEWMPRGQAPSSWDGMLADGSYAPSGTYKFAVKALHIFGKKGDVKEYDVMETEPFGIRYMKNGLKRRAVTMRV